MNRNIINLSGLLLLAGALTLAVLLNDPKSDMWTTHQYINIKTGQCRLTKMFYFIPVYQRVDNTVFSKSLKGISINVKPDMEPWQKAASSGCSMFHSLHYMFENYRVEARAAEYLFERANYSDAEKRKVAATVLSLWQKSGDCSLSSNYIESLLDSIPDA